MGRGEGVAGVYCEEVGVIFWYEDDNAITTLITTDIHLVPVISIIDNQ